MPGSIPLNESVINHPNDQWKVFLFIHLQQALFKLYLLELNLK